jgi:S-adenosylmethionine hydrolase
VQGQVDVWAGSVRDKAGVGTTFDDVVEGKLLAYQDSDGRLALAVNCGNASMRLRARSGDLVMLRRPG